MTDILYITIRSNPKKVRMPYEPTTFQVGLADQSIDIHPKRKDAILQRIINAYHKAIQVNPPSAYQPSAAWKAEIEHTRRDYMTALLNKDKEALGSLLDNFWRNSGAHSITKHSSYNNLKNSTGDPDQYGNTEDQRSFVAEVLLGLFQWQNIVVSSGGEVLDIPKIGNPYGVVIGRNNEVLVTPISCPQHYYAYRSERLINGLCTRKNPIIAEIGGGMGLLPYYLLRDNPNWSYFNFDLPEMLVVPSYFLMLALPHRRVWLYGEKYDRAHPGDILLLPNWGIRALPDNLVDLYINFHSFSEMGISAIEEYFRQIERTCRLALYYENSNYPQDITHEKAEEETTEVPIKAFPELKGFAELISNPSAWIEGVYVEKVFLKNSGYIREKIMYQ